MSNAIEDLQKARLAAIQDRRESGRRLSGIKAGDLEERQKMVLAHQVVEAIDAAIAHEEQTAAAERRRSSATVLDLDAL